MSSLTSASGELDLPCAASIPASSRQSLVGLLDVVDEQALADGLDVVDHVVELDRQVVDVLAVKGRHEDFLEARR